MRNGEEVAIQRKKKASPRSAEEEMKKPLGRRLIMAAFRNDETQREKPAISISKAIFI